MGEETGGPLTPPVFHILLSLVDGPLHGYGIMKRVEKESGQRMGPGTIYGSLQRLTEAGWVRESIEDAGGDQRRGVAFELTESGAAALRQEARRITRLAQLQPVRDVAAEPAT